MAPWRVESFGRTETDHPLTAFSLQCLMPLSRAAVNHQWNTATLLVTLDAFLQVSYRLRQCFFSPILSLKLTYHATPVALLQSRVLTPFIDSSSIDDKSCSLVLTRNVQYRYSGNSPPVGATPASTRATQPTSRFARLAPSYPPCRVVS